LRTLRVADLKKYDDPDHVGKASAVAAPTPKAHIRLAKKRWSQALSLARDKNFDDFDEFMSTSDEPLRF